ncbi:AIPR family protein [Streptomyces sp. DSM 40750]|uniref:AIPR family protein n=1 Tax=Streptomyces sp. DSM 40750 TaxID=2801030 RepID=UPI00214ABECA|nr:AIPR family protein [Streptomyces sp. DSM 40750]UUU18883.1 AIPR family protein [Streptomyces sp. DSM 40750]UUU27775.1 AIPR family protein [Streptomyces sp. DSM 40750]
MGDGEDTESTRAQTVGVIREALKREYDGLIDLGDLEGRNASETELVFTTRALAAMSLQLLTGCPPTEAAASVTDGRDDQGIDAIGCSPSAPELWLIQAKWSEQGKARFGVEGALKLLHGLRQLDNRDFDRFNDRVRQHADRVRDILESPECRVHLVVAVMGEQASKDQARLVIEQAAADFGAAVECHVLALPDFHAAAHRDALPRNVELVATLPSSWYTKDIPHRMFSGLVGADEVALWYQEHGARLFDRNLRGHLGVTALNLGLVETLRTTPEAFPYLHNGITVLCDSLETEFFSRPVQGAPVRLRLKGAAVVNGAQTVASVYYAYEKHPENVSLAAVPVRIICVANAPEDFARSVVAATHTQHRTESRDFVALDEVQSRIRDDFRAALGKEYVFRRGELVPTPTAGCSLEEAAVALACGHPDASLSAVANASTEHLWEATPEGTYTRLFGRRPSALQIWRSVLLLRAVREALHELKPGLTGRTAAIAERGSLLVAHLVFRLHGAEGIDEPDANWEHTLIDVPGRVRQVLAVLIPLVDDIFGSNSFIATIFREAERCRLLAERTVQTLTDVERTPQLVVAPPPQQPRRPSSARLLVEHRRIPDGTEVLYKPGHVEERAIGRWLDEDPRRYLATWSNDARHPLRWAADGHPYSINGLIRHIWQSADWREAWSAVQGARYWIVPGEGSLADLAEALWDVEAFRDTGE